MLEFFVKDTGMGIEPERLEVIFDRFVQANDQIHVTHGGTGLGLSIAKGFVELLGGTIWVESTLKIGTAFYFTIPYMPYSKQFATKPPPLLLPRRVKILIAEDEINNLLLLQEMLSGLDVSIVHAYNGLEALEYCKNDATFDLILMDIKMPIMDGLLSAKLIREQCKYLPIILQSAYEHDYEIEKQHKLYNGYLRKPINKKELLTKIIATLST
jgi:CheY-like chemotaxis protein